MRQVWELRGHVLQNMEFASTIGGRGEHLNCFIPTTRSGPTTPEVLGDFHGTHGLPSSQTYPRPSACHAKPSGLSHSLEPRLLKDAKTCMSYDLAAGRVLANVKARRFSGLGSI